MRRRLEARWHKRSKPCDLTATVNEAAVRGKLTFLSGEICLTCDRQITSEAAGRPSLGIAIIRVQYERLFKAVFRQYGALHQLRCKFTCLALMDLTADDLSTIDVHYQVEVVKQPSYKRRQVADIPSPDFVGPLSDVRGRHLCREGGIIMSSCPWDFRYCPKTCKTPRVILCWYYIY